MFFQWRRVSWYKHTLLLLLLTHPHTHTHKNTHMHIHSYSAYSLLSTQAKIISNVPALPKLTNSHILWKCLVNFENSLHSSAITKRIEFLTECSLTKVEYKCEFQYHQKLPNIALSDISEGELSVSNRQQNKNQCCPNSLAHIFAPSRPQVPRKYLHWLTIDLLKLWAKTSLRRVAWKLLTYVVICILSSVCSRWSLYSNYDVCNIWGWVLSTDPFSSSDCRNICIPSYHMHQIGNMIR